MRYLVSALLGALFLAALWGGYERWQHTRWRDYAKALERASAANLAAATALREQERAKYEEQAREADLSYSRKLADARASTSAYIASHRVQPSGSGPAKPEREADPAGVRQDVPRGAILVGEADVQRAAEWQAYALDLRKWALSVTE